MIRLALGLTAYVAIALLMGGSSDACAAENVLDVNDISVLWPVPKTTEDADQLISADTLLENGGTLWPSDSFEAVMQAAATIGFPRSPGLNPFSIKLPPALREPKAWKVAAIRFDASAPGSHSDLVLKFGSTPQIRLILQPVNRDPLKVRDFTAHLVFDYSAPPTGEQPQRAAPDRKVFGAILKDLREIKRLVETTDSSTRGPLSVHPGLSENVPGVREKLAELLKKRLDAKRLRAVSFMGIDPPEPWIFFAMSRSKSDGSFKLFAPPSIAPATAQMLSFRGVDRVVPQPHLLEHKVSTSLLFAQNITARLDQPVSAELPDVRLRDVPAIIANPEKAHFFNTDCVSCHSESTRRSALKISEDSPFSFQRPPNVSGVNDALIPRDSWNVRNFGWGVERTGRVAATVSNRTANEAAESVAFINKEFAVQAPNDGGLTPLPGEANEPIAHALTLVMTAKSEQDYAEVKTAIQDLQKDPSNPIKKALNEIGVVHDARFVFFDEHQQLGVITTFDDELDVYLELFISEIGDVFDLVLAHMKDAPPLPVAEHSAEFHEYVRKNNRELTPPFYSAYPDLRVSDILRMNRESKVASKSGESAARAESP